MKKDLIEHVSAAFSGIWVQTHQADEAEAEIRQAAKNQEWELAVWDIANGIRSSNGSKGVAAGDPLGGVKHLEGMAGQTCVLLVHNMHRFLGNAELVQVIQNTLISGKADRRFLLVFSPIVQIPPELEKMFVVQEHALPDHQQLIEMVQGLLGDDKPGDEAFGRIAEAAMGPVQPRRPPRIALASVIIAFIGAYFEWLWLMMTGILLVPILDLPWNSGSH